MRRKFVVEFGMGIDLHGQNVTKAARKAVRDAIGQSCLAGLQQIYDVRPENKNAQDIVSVDLKVACPRPNELDQAAVLSELPFVNKSIKVVEGGMSVPTICVESLGDKNEDADVALAAVTVWVEI